MCAKTVNYYFDFNGLINNKKASYELFRLAVRSNSAITMHMQNIISNLIHSEVEWDFWFVNFLW